MEEVGDASCYILRSKTSPLNIDYIYRLVGIPDQPRKEQRIH